MTVRSAEAEDGEKKCPLWEWFDCMRIAGMGPGTNLIC